ncbi:sugar-binding transcriptional regulator [Jannaschia aquimarina]|uniref:DeoR_2 protein n=1 Tax=Jannaschia aquimarina TaxID=935700 RepID=A0A0D1CLE9_9RHOB|nr:sugar-binding transcriptional regulator [Jannaschia aquimarina]KIT15637.1 Deoxyribonucleoside regulator [Jannaschia aquimarina]SNT03163.1 DNA-binding transcriptional regulator LsrR, DeoR family [Jannaschia aquimarina]
MSDLAASLPGAAARAAYLYHVEDLSQAEVAAKLGVSRATVHNLLREARETGLVRVTLDPDLLSRAEAAQNLTARYDLQSAVVFPGDNEEAALKAAAGMLEGLVPHGARLGVAWGETVYRLAQHLPPARRGDLTVVQVVGSMASPHGFNAEDCSSLIAQRFGTTCVNLHAPAVLSNPALVAALEAEPIIARQLDALRGCDAVLFAVGLADKDSHIVQAGVVDPATLDDYAARGAVGVVAGRFIDAEGREMRGSMDGRLIGIDLAALRAVPLRIGVAFGARRAGSLQAALRNGLVTHLLTDSGAAGPLLSRFSGAAAE